MKKLFLLAIISAFVFVGCKDEGTDPNGSGNGTVSVDRTQRSSLWYYTATWCGPCGISGSPTFKSVLDQSTDNEIVAIDLHATNSRLAPIFQNPNDQKFYYSPIMGGIGAHLRLNGYIPAFTLNNNFEGNSSVSANALVSYAGYWNDVQASVGVNGSATASGNDLTIKTKTKFFDAADGDYYISLIVVEKDVNAPQVVGSVEQQSFDHKHIARCSALGTFTNQETFRKISSGAVTANSEVDGSYSFTIEQYADGALPGYATWEFDPANTAVVASIWTPSSSNPAVYDCVNTVWLDVK